MFCCGSIARCTRMSEDGEQSPNPRRKSNRRAILGRTCSPGSWDVRWSTPHYSALGVWRWDHGGKESFTFWLRRLVLTVSIHGYAIGRVSRRRLRNRRRRYCLRRSCYGYDKASSGNQPDHSYPPFFTVGFFNLAVGGSKQRGMPRISFLQLRRKGQRIMLLRC